MIVPKLAHIQALLRPKWLPLNSCSSPNGSHTADQPTSATKLGLIKCLIDHGIPSDASEEIVLALPTDKVDEGEVRQTLTSLHSLQFGLHRLVDLLKTHPCLILTPANRISKCHTNLSSIFTQNYVYKILTNSPNVVDQKRSVLAEKINYLNTDLKIPNAYIVNSSALSYPIFHLKVRSEFLKRCGVFKMPTKKRDEVMLVVNLNDMFDSSNAQFATKVARLSPAEFEVFSTLYSREVESDSENEEDSDSD